MSLRARIRAVASGRPASQEAGGRCAADWRRPDGYWRCTRAAGHRGRHRMRAASPGPHQAAARERAPSSGEGGIAAG